MEKLETIAARLELEQAQREYRATWTDTSNSEMEKALWEYAGAAYLAWAEVWDENDWWCETHDMCEINCSEMH
jgi:hypothetical protein